MQSVEFWVEQKSDFHERAMEGTLPQNWLVSLFETYCETHAFERITCARSVPSEFVDAVHMIMNLHGDVTNVDIVVAEKDIRENIFKTVCKPKQSADIEAPKTCTLLRINGGGKCQITTTTYTNEQASV